MAQMEIFALMAAPGPEAAATAASDPATPAIHRVLEKAQAQGVVRRAGIYADVPQEVSADDARFDWQLTIDRAIALGLLGPGEHFNTYQLTEAGMAALVAAASKPATGRREQMQ